MAARKESESPRTTVQKTSDREVVVTRTFDAPARLVFQAWSNPELFKKWWVPRSMGMTLRSCDMDVLTGGKYRLVFGDDPANTMAFFGRYIEVVPDQRIVWTNEESGDPGSVTTVTFEERDGRTLLVMSELYPTKEALDEAGTGAQEATHETFGQLDELLAGLSAR
ncbi:SRPBCC family protein [Dokdonella sp.]|uniref:SRPBCC family protein n=1 Tax=Dokdonella sp. TaxID=2291710 RepID=UPI0037841DF3